MGSVEKIVFNIMFARKLFIYTEQLLNFSVLSVLTIVGRTDKNCWNVSVEAVTL